VLIEFVDRRGWACLQGCVVINKPEGVFRKQSCLNDIQQKPLCATVAALGRRYMLTRCELTEICTSVSPIR